MNEATKTFGCQECFDGDADQAYARLLNHEEVARLIDEPHFIVRIVRCRVCGQAFATIFAETVDFRGGEDPQSRTLVPLSSDEVEVLTRGGFDWSVVTGWAKQRRQLCMDWPSEATTKKVWWSDGPLMVRQHD